MRRPLTWLSVTALVIVLVSLSPSPAAGQDRAETWTAPRTPHGHPDLQGVWSNNGATPLERPENLSDRESLTDEEVAEIVERADAILHDGNEQAGDVLGGSLFRQAVEDPTLQTFDDVTGNYNTFWVVEQRFDNRTSLIVDPPNGRLPALTDAAIARRADLARTGALALSPEGPEDAGLTVRCLSYGAPNLLTGYNSYFQILQTPTHVVILQELIHDARVISLDGRPHLNENMRQWHGDSRGRWDGNTLVVETRNYSPQSGILGAQGGDAGTLHIVERFTRVGPTEVRWDVTFTDPTTWTQPWTASMFLQQSPDAIYEYACHEGNYSLDGMLAGARHQEGSAGSR